MTKTNYSKNIISAKQATHDFSENVGFKRIGIHFVTLAPGARSSLPHAESLEEEFVFVISGNPHVWIDGFVHELKPNCAVGFPSGTGIAHNFINNSHNNVELLVVGEKTKKENRCSFPVNPEQKEKSGIWWVDAPQRPLGPHNGNVGPVRDGEVGSRWPDFIVDCGQLKTSQGWHYPGDSETFRESVRLTDHLGLKVLGINFETIAPGKRSAFPHSHKAEEEFAFILSGKAHIWLNGFTYEAKAGEGVAFLPETNIAHVLINDSQDPVRYIMIGEATDDANEDRVFYPNHHFRNEQCLKQKFLWQNRPEVQMGSHNGRPQCGLSDHLALEYAKTTDENQILDLFEKSLKYFQAVEGCGPNLQMIHKILQDEPEKKIESYLKEFLFIVHNDKPIGVVDLHINHPHPGIVYVGLLLLTEDVFGQGLGCRSYQLVEHYVKSIFAAKILRIGISEDNDASAFWKKMGFTANGKTYSWKGENKTTSVLEYEKPVLPE